MRNFLIIFLSLGFSLFSKNVFADEIKDEKGSIFEVVNDDEDDDVYCFKKKRLLSGISR